MNGHSIKMSGQFGIPYMILVNVKIYCSIMYLYVELLILNDEVHSIPVIQQYAVDSL